VAAQSESGTSSVATHVTKTKSISWPFAPKAHFDSPVKSVTCLVNIDLDSYRAGTSNFSPWADPTALEPGYQLIHIQDTELQPPSTMDTNVEDNKSPTTIGSPSEASPKKPTPSQRVASDLEHAFASRGGNEVPVYPRESPPKYFDELEELSPLGPRHLARIAADSIKVEPLGWLLGAHTDMTTEQRNELSALVQSHSSNFALGFADLGCYDGEHGPITINLSTDQPILAKARRTSAYEDEITEKKIAPLKEHGLVVLCPVLRYSCNNVIAAKKAANGEWTDLRFCQNYKSINRFIEKSGYQLPLADRLHLEVADSRYFSKLDARSGFLQIPVAEADQPKTAFYAGGQLYMYTRMPFGMKNSPAEFQMRMDSAIALFGLTKFAVVYIDDILIHSRTFGEHLDHLNLVFAMLKSINMKAHPEKSIFGAAVLEFLGHNVSHYGMFPSEAKVDAIKALPEPKDVPQLRSILGFMNYYRVYVAGYSAIAEPLNSLLKKDHQWQWTSVEGNALMTLKEKLCDSDCILKRADPQKEFILHTDWSTFGMGAVLGQLDDQGREHIVACISRSLNIHERRYSSYKGELLAAVWAVKSFDFYLRGRRFTLVTDHAPLQYLMKNDDLKGQYARWSLSLQEYDFEIMHRPGALHQNADALSRFPRASSEDVTGARLDEDERGQMGIQAHSYLAMSLAQQPLQILPIHLEQPPNTYASHCGLSKALHECYHSVAQNDAQNMTASEHIPHFEDEVRGGPEHEDYLEYPPSLPIPTLSSPADYTPLRHINATTLKSEGVTVLELFGGLCAGLEALLRNGVSVKRYIYCDTSAAARIVSCHRLKLFSQEYGHGLLPPAAYEQTYHTLPDNVYDINRSQLENAGAKDGTQWILIAGWECQDLSPAGKGRGLVGPRSSTFIPMMSILRVLQNLQCERPPIYIIENTAMQFSHNHKVRLDKDFTTVCDMLGAPVCIDAARLGSGAHRLRNWWTNLSNPEVLSRTLELVPFPTSDINDFLGSGRRTQIAQVNHGINGTPYWSPNKAGYPMRVLPTLMATVNSYAFRDGKPGMIYNASGVLTSLTMEEREMALGYAPGCTKAPGITQPERHKITGQCMDGYALFHLLRAGIKVANENRTGGISRSRVWKAPTRVSFFSSQTPVVDPGNALEQAVDATNIIHAFLADTQEQSLAANYSDIWQDKETLSYLQCDGSQGPGDQPWSRRAARRAQSYTYFGTALYRIMGTENRTWKEVPPPDARTEVIATVHIGKGHFGRSRTLYAVLQQYWWAGIYQDVAAYVRSCPSCSRVSDSYPMTSHAELQSLPLQPLFFRWHLDLCGPFPVTERGNTYVLVAIEAFSKTAELIPIPSKSSSAVSYAFLHNIISRYGACAVVVSDQGGEFKGDFADLCATAMIDHRQTSAHHPQANGLAERAVQTLKRCLRKLVDRDPKNPDEPPSWDIDTAWVSLAYRLTPQETTRLPPFRLLFGHDPDVPTAAKRALAEPINMDNEELAITNLMQRSAITQQHCAMAGTNGAIAQHRDTLRYAMLRSGAYLPSVQQFQKGDFVYVRYTTDSPHNRPTALDFSIRPEILRVKDARRDVLVLEGKDGETTNQHRSRCTPCHLQIDDDIIDPNLAQRPRADLPCTICNYPHDDHLMILCDECDGPYHTYCLTPALIDVPSGYWCCPNCTPTQRVYEQQFVGRTDNVTEENTLEPKRRGPGRPRKGDLPRPSKVISIQSPTRRSPRLPQNTVVSAAAAVKVDLTDFDFTEADGVEKALQTLMPGLWTKGHITKLKNQMPGGKRFIRPPDAIHDANKPQRVATSKDEVQGLCAIVDLASVGDVCDMFAGTNTVRLVLERYNIRVHTNDVDSDLLTETHLDGLQPSSYRMVRKKGIEAVVMSPPFALLDIALPVAIQSGISLVCCHIPGTYLTEGNDQRRTYLRELQNEQRITFLLGLPRAQMGWRCAWIIVTASAHLHQKLVRGQNQLTFC
jgi:hypothetical protein